MKRTEKHVAIFLLTALAAGLLFFSLSKYRFYQRYIDIDNAVMMEEAPKEQAGQNLNVDEKREDSYVRAAGNMEKVDINGAELEELIKLPGIGRETALRIIEYRTAHGPFTEIRELLEVKGIGEKKLAMLEEYIMIE